MNQPVIGIIGGSGVAHQLAQHVRGTEQDIDTPFGRPSSPPVLLEWEGARLVVIARHGRAHTIPPSAVPYRANIWALKSLGVTHVLASGATGSLREEIRPRDLVIPSQLIDRTCRRAGSFFDQAGVVAHVEFAEPFCPILRQRLLRVADAAATTVHDGGTYVCMEGPAFSTIAESRMHRAWGGDLIGMTCLPEAKLAREAELCYALVAFATDYDCWRPHAPGQDAKALLEEIMHNFHEATAHSFALLQAAVRSLAGDPPGDCPCRHALARAIWSDRGKLLAQDWERVSLLVERYLGKKA